MRKTLILAATLSLLVTTPGASGLTDSGEPRGGLLTFIEPNLGQANTDYTHVARASDYTALLRADGAHFMVSDQAPDASSIERALLSGESLPAPAARASVRMQLVGANGRGEGVPSHSLTGQSNYLYGSDAKRWVTGVPHFAVLQFEDVYPGIDVVYTLEDSVLRYDFVLAPSADANAIRLRFDGARQVRLNDSGDLLVRVGALEMVHSSPKIFQQVDGKQHDIDGGFVVQDDGSLQFRVSRHDPQVSLVIDPQVTLSTYLGGSRGDGAQDITVDSSDRMVVVGTTGSLDFPSATSIGSAPTGGTDIFVARFAPDGQSLEFATYIGGTGFDNPHQVEIDAGGNIVLAGFTSSPDFPTMNAFQPGFLGGGLSDADAFVAKLDPTGASLVYSTYIGGPAPIDSQFGFEWVRGLALDVAGNAYVVGETSSPDFPANDTVAGRACLEDELGVVSPLIGDAFVAKFTPTGALDFAVCIGGSERDTGRGIALSPDGAIHITGFTRSPNYPVSANAFQTELSAPGIPSYDVHVTRLDPSGTQIDFASLVGGTMTEFAQQVRILSDGSSVVAGTSFSADFPTTAGAYQPDKAGAADFSEDAIVFRLSAGGTSMRFATFLGGSSADYGWGLDVDAEERIYVSSVTDSLDFPQVNATQATRGGPASVNGSIGSATDDTRALATDVVLVNGELLTTLAAVNSGQSRVYTLDASISVQNVQDIGVPADESVAAALVDVDVDQAADALILVNRGAPSRAYFADGMGGFLPPADLSPSNSAASAIVVGNLLGSPEPDLVIGNNGAPNVVYPGAIGGFGVGQMLLPGSELTATLSLAVGDLNRDGFVDVVEGNDGRNNIYFGTGSGFLQAVELGSESARSTAIAVADMDNDGDPDVVVGNDGAPNRLYRNQGDGSFAFLQDLDLGVATTQSLVIFDLNGDGVQDIVTADAGLGVAYVNNGTGAFTRLDLMGQPAPASSIVGGPPTGVFRSPLGTSIEALDLSLTDSYLAVFDPSGRELLYSSYVGGGGSDRSEWGLFVKDAANVYLAGSTAARNFPTTAPFQPALSGVGDAFITKFALDDLVSPTPSAVYETVIDLVAPTVDGVTQVIIKWSTLGCNESASADLYDYELLLLADGEIVYSDAVIRNGILEPFRDLQRANPTWDYDLGSLTLRQLNTGIDSLIDLPEAFGTNYLVTDNDSLPDDGLLAISRFDNGEFIEGDNVMIANQTTFVVAGDCDADGVDASIDNCVFEANADQRDTDGDNIGNACDADLNNDCTINVVDLGILRNVFFTNDADADFNGDGVVNVTDLGILRSAFFGTPGPSGLPNSCQ